MKQTTFILLITILLFSCKKQQTGIEIDFSKNEQCKLSSIVDSIKTIRLETSSEYLIGHVDAFYKDGDVLFILDAKQKTVFIFSVRGKYINKINYIGRGVGEYNRIKCICLNRYKNILHIFDNCQQKMLSYNYNGQFINETKLKEKTSITSFCALENGHYFFVYPMYHSMFDKEIWQVDSLFNQVKIHKYHDSKYLFPYYTPNYFFGNDREMKYYDYFGNKIYDFFGNKINIVCEFNIKQLISKDLLKQENLTPDVVKNYRNADTFYFNCGVSETTNSYVMRFVSNRQKNVSVFLRKSDLKVIITDLIINDLDNNIVMNPDFFSFDKDAVCSFVFSDTSEDNPKIKLFYLK